MRSWSALPWGHTTSEQKTLGSTHAAVLPGPHASLQHHTIFHRQRNVRHTKRHTSENYRITKTEWPNQMTFKVYFALYGKKMGILGSLWGFCLFFCFVLIALGSTENALFWKYIFKFYASRPHNEVNIKTIWTSLNFNSATLQAVSFFFYPKSIEDLSSFDPKTKDVKLWSYYHNFKLSNLSLHKMMV